MSICLSITLFWWIIYLPLWKSRLLWCWTSKMLNTLVYIIKKTYSLFTLSLSSIVCMHRNYVSATWRGNAGQNNLEFYNTWGRRRATRVPTVVVRSCELNVCYCKGISTSVSSIYLSIYYHLLVASFLWDSWRISKWEYEQWKNMTQV